MLPFLFVGLFTTRLLELFRKYRGVVRYTVKIGGILMVLMGILMFTGKMNDVTGYLSRISGTQVPRTERMEEGTVAEKAEADNEGESTESGDQAGLKAQLLQRRLPVKQRLQKRQPMRVP